MMDLSLLAIASPASYLIAFAVPALDAILPVLPSETAVIALGVATADRTDPRIAVLVVLAACGAFVGDNLAYLIGRRFGPAARRRFFASARGERRLAWAGRALDRFGIWIIIACRFIPGGRTAVTLSCGLIGYRRRSFVFATVCAAGVWAAYAFFLGRLGGRAFENRPWAGLLVALGFSLVLSVVIEVLRRTRPWRALGWIRRPGSAGPSRRHRSPGSTASPE
jgi:membrane-associated protein